MPRAREKATGDGRIARVCLSDGLRLCLWRSVHVLPRAAPALRFFCRVEWGRDPGGRVSRVTSLSPLAGIISRETA